MNGSSHTPPAPGPDEQATDAEALRWRLDEAEQEVRLHQALMETAGEGIAIIQFDGRILRVNPAFCRMVGYREDELKGMHAWTLDVDRTHEDGLRIVAELREHKQLHMEARFRTRTGEVIDVDIAAGQFRVRDLELMVALVRDVTRRKHTESALRDSEARWRALTESLNAAVFIHDGQRLVYANRALARLTGYTADELLGMEIGALLPPGDRERVVQRGRNRLAGKKEPEHYPTRLLTRAGDIRHASVSMSTVEIGGQRLGIGASFDITAMVEAQEALQRSRQELRALAAQLTATEERERRRLAELLHDEIGQNLAACRMQLALMEQQTDAATQARAVELCCTLIDETIRRTRDLTLELSSPALYGLGLAAALEELCRRTQKMGAMQVDFEAPGAEQPASDDERAFLYRAARELLANAAQHGAAARVRVELQREGNCAKLTIQDDGTGFDVGRIGMGPSESGGYGLFSLRERVNQFGGVLDAWSKPGQGARIGVTLPLAALASPDLAGGWEAP